MMIFSLFNFYVMSFNYSSIFGIDVSLATLDIVELCKGQKKQVSKLNNSASKIQRWLKQIAGKNILCVLEPTGCYSSLLLHYLNLYDIDVKLVNPNQSHGFTKALGIISKNDQQAAHSLAMMGQCLDLPLYNHPDDRMQKRKQLLMGINALKKQKQVLRNQLHALDYQIIFAPKVVEALKQTLATVEQQLEQLEEQLNDSTDEEHQQQMDLITSVVGIGSKTAQLLLKATGGLQHFKHARQLSKFTGLVPHSHYSGSSVRIKGRITKKGDKLLRACLYMAARSAKRFNLACKDLYERLRSLGKPHKQAMVAVMNKLIKQAFGVVCSGVAFDNQFYLKYKK